MLKCSCFWSKKNCQNKAIYRENKYTPLCAICYGQISETLFNIWHKWFRSGKKGNEPFITVFHRDKII